ncbi:MAG: hypothetical protein LBT69_04600 [Lactobacillales bacterium]|jgi:hypothetical protein|nr:hypothetical protein [Lactobacillales bacterium]
MPKGFVLNFEISILAERGRMRRQAHERPLSARIDFKKRNLKVIQQAIFKILRLFLEIVNNVFL